MKKNNKESLSGPVRERRAVSKGSSNQQNRHGLPVVSRQEDLAALFGVAGEDPAVQESFAEAFSGGYADEGQAFELLQRQDDGGRGQRSVPAAAKRSLQKLTPEAELDLHGLNARQAETRTDAFVRAARHKGLRLVLIITGRGLHSPGRMAVLPGAVENRLRELKTEGLVRSFVWEKRTREESGALLVTLA